jgi:hypothetical protein
VWYSPSGGSWQLLSPYSASASYVWDTTGATLGTYDFQVWARQQGDGDAYDTWTGFTYDLTAASSPCASVSTTTSPSFVAGGTAVTLSSSATGCASPEYQVWYLPPGGSYELLQDYSASATYVWNAPATPLGVSSFQVWARQSGSSVAYDAWDTFSIDVNAAPSVSATTHPALASWAGTQVTITSSSTGLSSPEYAVYVLPPGGSWQLLGPYSSSPSYVWDTTGATPGTYGLQVWARQQGDGDAYDAYGQLTFDLSATAELCCPSGEKKLSPLLCGSVADPDLGCGAAWSSWGSGWPTPCSGGHAKWGCASGACVVVGCDPGYADCDGKTSNGCEADLSSLATCGSCGVTCTGSQICNAGTCGSTCPAPLTYCNGACVDLTSTLAHCGNCGNACTDPVHGFGVCASSVCNNYCDPGYTAVSGNKCADIANDPSCCGASCTSCARPYGGDAVCNAGVCGMICESGWTLCGGACVDTQQDVANCGACGATCSGICTAGACDTTANPIIAQGTSPQSLAADGTSVFWIDGGNVMQVDRGGLSAPIMLATGQQGPRQLALSGSSVFWINGTGGGLWTTTKGTPGATFVTNTTNPSHLAANSTYVYYDFNGDALYRVPTAGGAPQLVYTGTVTGIAADDSYVFFVESNHVLYRANPDGSGLTGTIAFGMSSLAVGGGYVVSNTNAENLYFLDESTPEVETAIWFGQSTATVTAEATDGTYAYASLTGSGQTWALNTPGLFRSYLACRGPVERISPTSPQSNAAIDGQWIYWAASGAIYRTAR